MKTTEATVPARSISNLFPLKLPIKKPKSVIIRPKKISIAVLFCKAERIPICRKLFESLFLENKTLRKIKLKITIEITKNQSSGIAF